MAKQLDCSSAWVYNRHDRKRGTQPPDCICRNRECGANFHDVGIKTYAGTFRTLIGDYEVGPGGGTRLVAKVYNDYSATIRCCECECEQPQHELEEILLHPDAVTFEEQNRAENDQEVGLELKGRYARLVLGL